MKYLIEACLLLMIVFFGVEAVTYYHQLNKQQKELELKTELNRFATELSLETLSAMDSNIYHFDRHAQKQLEYERLNRELSLNQVLAPNVNQALQEFQSTIDNYMQLASMLKTSYRYIAKQTLSISQYKLPQQNIINEVVALVSNLHVTNSIPIIQSVNNELETLLPKLKSFEQNAPEIRVMRLHVNFVLENALSASNLLMPIQESELSKVVLKDIQQVTNAIERTYWKLVKSVSFLLFGVFLLVITAMSRLMEDLKRANSLANQAAETKSLFLSNMSHEIRTPMNGIMGLTDILLTTELTNVQRNYLEKVRFSANALTTIINDILDFSKIESKKLHIENIPFQFEDLLDNLRSLITPLANTKGVKLIFDIDPALSEEYFGDPVRINQIMLNFASNAVKFTEEGSITLSVRRAAKEAACEEIEIAIKDTGIGISQDKVEQLFERFTQAESSTTRKYGGTGLGLTICKLLTELMNGQIKVSSELGKGSTFKVLLPLEAKFSGSSKASGDSNFNGSILIVEDDPIYMEVSSVIANSIGLSATVVANGEQAKSALANTSFDWLLLDWVLPDFEANELLRELDKQATLTSNVIIYTAHSEECINTDLPYPILYKPLLKRDLISLLSEQEANKNIQNQQGAPSQLHKPDIDSKKKAVPPPTSIQLGPNYRVLLVEDNDINRIVAVKLLENFGVEIIIAVNGQEAIDKVNHYEGDIDIVFMDIQMPVMDGLEATRILRERYDMDMLTIIALTANVMQSEIDKYKAIGMNGHLGKPFKVNELEAIFIGHIKLASE